jgi:glycosyltransferase involved in cell wall biosynthesis
MKVLFLCNKSPWPTLEGGSIAMYNLIKGLLAAGHQVKVLAVNSEKFHVNPSTIPADFKQQTGIELVDIDLKIKPIDAFLNLFTNSSYHVERFISADFGHKLTEILQRSQFDIVQMETIFMMPYVDIIRSHSKAIVVLRAHNIEHLIWKRIADKTTNVCKRWYLRHLTRTLRTYELKVLSQADGIAAITRKDAGFFRRITSTPVVDIPFGIDVKDIEYELENKREPGFFHIGAMNWMPNEEGMRWFLEKVWPLINEKFPVLKMHLAGRYMPQWITKGKFPNVEVVGEVADAGDFVRKHDVAIVPLLSGSGIRIKIIEAMAQAKPVITTEVGAEGIMYKDRENILIAATPDDFLQCAAMYVQEPELFERIGRNARSLVEEVYDNAKITERLLIFYNALRKQLHYRIQSDKQD